MRKRITENRVRTLDEAKEIVVELEERKGIQLSGPRGSLWSASECIDYDQAYVNYVEVAMGRTAGLAIEAGHDDIATKATQLITELQESMAADE